MLHHDITQGPSNHRGNLAVSVAYRWILWTLCLWIVLVLPTLAGGRFLAAIAERQAQVDPEQKYPTGYQWQKHWLVRYGVRILMLVPILIFRLSCTLFRRLRRRWNRRIEQAEPILVMTNSNDGGSRPGSRHGPSPISRGRTPLRILKPSQSRRSFVIGGICGVVSTITILWTVGSFVMQSSSEEMQMLPTMVSWLCAVGLLLSSVLNGFGSVSLPHSCLAGIYLEPIRPEVIVTAEVELQKMTSSLVSKRAELAPDMSSPSSSADLSSIGTRRWPAQNKKSFADYGSEDVSQRKLQVQNDVNFLETLVEELAEDIVEMKYSQETAALARTTMGKIRSWLGVIFSLVLLIRLYTSITSIVRFNAATETRRSDPITMGLLWLTGHHLVSQEDYDSLSQCVSLLLTAFLSVSQVRMFLRTVTALNLRLTRLYRNCNCKSRSQTKVLFGGAQSYAHLLAALMGCYFLSCVVLTKMNLPLEYRSGFSTAMGGTDFVVQSTVANSVFCASAVISAIVLGLLFGIQRQNTKRHLVDDAAGNLDSC